MEKCFSQVPTPGYVIDENLLIKNLEILQYVMDKSGCKILLAQKAFSMFYLYPLISKYLIGTAASGLFEARLGHEEFDGETHIFSPAYQEKEFPVITKICDHIIFNSFSQWEKFSPAAMAAGKSCGMRINPEFSTQDGHAIYDPCAPYSRLGVTETEFKGNDAAGLDGLHLHTLCEQTQEPLLATLEVFEAKFGSYLKNMKWLNLGGGHHITRNDYDVEVLIETILRLRKTYDIEVYLEPGEAVVLNTGFLVTTVLETIHNGMDILILDTSAACHMPDVLEMPYRPEIIGAGLPGEKNYSYRLGGPTCLAGDIIGDYSFDTAVNPGDRLVFCDMAHYTMVKNNTFNGMALPSISVYSTDKEIKIIREFGFEDFKQRLS
ncbi:carboxynorspermidine decarboxylase [Parasporobacterium paucivorans]|uniref:Carboxynorspermidine decarboxylase n=1 Tax=Parasporobacterium paucivorans DSM 15970 TaxID=1122934 RepID=A0A1M6AH96_9FIRM|nr:carboxynorspermidine decarboxylase [Parasporobacterium paucivorans DSM 15970]